MENKNQEKELDLLDLIKIFWNLLEKYLFKPLALVVKICFKRWKVFLGAIILGVVLSIVVPTCILKKNKADIILKNSVAISSSYIKEIEGLSEMNKGRLASILQLDEETIKKLVKLKPHKVISVDSTLVNYVVDEKDNVGAEETLFNIHPSMFALEVLAKDTVSLSILADAVIDQFGKDVMMMPVDAEHFTITVPIEVSPTFFAWVSTFGRKVKILAPAPVVEKMKAFIQASADMYKDD